MPLNERVSRRDFLFKKPAKIVANNIRNVVQAGGIAGEVVAIASFAMYGYRKAQSDILMREIPVTELTNPARPNQTITRQKPRNEYEQRAAMVASNLDDSADRWSDVGLISLVAAIPETFLNLQELVEKLEENP